MDAPAIDHRVTVDSLHGSQAAALSAVLHFHACGGVRNLYRINNLVSLDGLLQAISYGLLRILSANPTSWSALALLTAYAQHIKATAGTVGGT
ncbi:hypothetical protein E2562_016896 [Oryza meyeriana var. granulata]|uniref:Uncharacterized protein n=1 Tax=Oryza meyeriana var. granulata TaxID=110450 RepID=A0A6G1DX66_9ORYZ|nr:hypothetical protein E2562_016896 [Oryza meyeriana var. granulata]